jgi:hypothetical protein
MKATSSKRKQQGHEKAKPISNKEHDELPPVTDLYIDAVNTLIMEHPTVQSTFSGHTIRWKMSGKKGKGQEDLK